MCKFAAGQQTNTVKLPVGFLKFKEIVRSLRVNETKPDTENASNWINFGFGIKNISKFNRGEFRVSHNPYTMDNEDLYF